MREKGVNEIVLDTIGEEYVVVVGFGIERYETEVEAGLSEEKIETLCLKAKEFYNKNKQNMEKTPLGMQRIIIKKFLNDEEITEFDVIN
ncbi:hypothetical protein [Arcobacter sp. LA11]|uniref:hypothetical protein n=1 Tax=Arcobacter sp. LA11 TaxID=1898176 RepID=UPI00093282CC|nr:hypothetical protein [Arcobacter sp. LA11]